MIYPQKRYSVKDLELAAIYRWDLFVTFVVTEGDNQLYRNNSYDMAQRFAKFHGRKTGRSTTIVPHFYDGKGQRITERRAMAILRTALGSSEALALARS